MISWQSSEFLRGGFKTLFWVELLFKPCVPPGYCGFPSHRSESSRLAQQTVNWPSWAESPVFPAAHTEHAASCLMHETALQSCYRPLQIRLINSTRLLNSHKYLGVLVKLLSASEQAEQDGRTLLHNHKCWNVTEYIYWSTFIFASKYFNITPSQRETFYFYRGLLNMKFVWFQLVKREDSLLFFITLMTLLTSLKTSLWDLRNWWAEECSDVL